MISNGSLITPLIIEKMTGLWHLERIQITMDVIEIPSEYALVTEACGSGGIPDQNEGPMNDIF